MRNGSACWWRVLLAVCDAAHLTFPLDFPETVCSAHGFVFDQAAFILAHRRNNKVASFLQQFRNSQARPPRAANLAHAWPRPGALLSQQLAAV